MLQPLYKMKPGEWYSRKKLYDGFRTTQQVYGRAGYMEWTPAPMFKYSDDPDPIHQAAMALVPPMLLAPEEPEGGGKQPDPIVNVNVLFQEGPRYFVNRITFTGNTTTRDNVIRREMRLYERRACSTPRRSSSASGGSTSSATSARFTATSATRRSTRTPTGRIPWTSR